MLIHLAVVLSVAVVAIRANDPELTRTLDRLMTNYDKRIRPSYGGKPVDVDISMYVLKMYEFCETNQEFKLNIYFRQKWTDSRLAFQSRESKAFGLTKETVDRIWIPDTFFPSSTDGKLMDITTPNVFLRITPKGEIFLSNRLTVSAACDLNTGFYPMERLACYMIFESYGYSTSDVNYKLANKWNADVNVAIEFGENRLMMFDVVDTESEITVSSSSSGNYSRGAIKITIDRRSSSFVWRFYLPVIGLVIASWLPLFLKRSAQVARIMLSSLVLLGMVLFVGLVVTLYLPSSLATTSLDIYLVVCLAIILLTLAAVVYLSFAGDDGRLTDIKNGGDATATDDKRAAFVTTADDRKLAKMETFAQIGLPLFFVLFNVAYWMVCIICPIMSA